MLNIGPRSKYRIYNIIHKIKHITARYKHPRLDLFALKSTHEKAENYVEKINLLPAKFFNLILIQVLEAVSDSVSVIQFTTSSG